jgi:homocysteine S-methyltransferase
MRDQIGDFLRFQPLMVLDGALATELEVLGADLRDPLWSAKCLVENPNLIRTVHLNYFNAGADLATTATYQASFAGFAQRGLDAQSAASLMRSAVALASSARDEFWALSQNRVNRQRPLIAASVGPYGATLGDGSEYRGQYGLGIEELLDFHRPRLRVLADSGADLLACETIPCLAEAKALAHALLEFPELTAWMSFSCRDGWHNAEGENLGDCVEHLNGYPQITAVGVNCSKPEYVASLLDTLRDRTAKPLLVYPNSGEAYNPHSKHWAGHAASLQFGEQALVWYRRGARLIGGCCRTSFSDIRDIRQCAESLRQP